MMRRGSILEVEMFLRTISARQFSSCTSISCTEPSRYRDRPRVEKSASMAMTFLPALARRYAAVADMMVLPVPPLGLTKAITVPRREDSVPGGPSSDDVCIISVPQQVCHVPRNRLHEGFRLQRHAYAWGGDGRNTRGGFWHEGCFGGVEDLQVRSVRG